MAENINDITIDYEENGIKIVKEIDKEVLSKGAWTTIIFRYQDWNRSTEEYGPDKYSIRRYKKVNGTFRQQSKFNISSEKQAAQLVEILSRWIKN
ncbi:MAG: hypothetical protein JXQ65_13850 [Candidatus Marinimicrobia bacterium]|nr:hypothetical protein [Candidatus Neomarinimicrobiota bacterium]